jgi:hypothetical protein
MVTPWRKHILTPRLPSRTARFSRCSTSAEADLHPGGRFVLCLFGELLELPSG